MDSRPGRQFSWPAVTLVLSVTLIMLLAGIQYYRYASAPPRDVIAIGEARFLDTETLKPPEPESGAWRKVALPHDWRKADVEAREGWYSIELKFRVPPNRLWGLYVPRVTSNIAAYINGENIGSGGRFNDPVARNENRPLYFSIPNGYLGNGINTLNLRVKAAAGKHGYLGPVYIGPDEVLRPVFQRFYRLKVVVVEIATASLVLVAVLMIGLWSVRREDGLALWFALVCLAWALHNFNVLVVEIPVSVHVWECVRYLSDGWFAVMLVMFTHRLLDMRLPRFEFLLFAGVSAGSLWLCAIDDAQTFFHIANSYWVTASYLLGLYPAARLFSAWLKTGDSEYMIAVCAGVPVLLTSGHDWLMLNGQVSPHHGLLMQYSAATLLLGFTVVLLIRYGRAVNASEELMRTLESRVRQRGRELESNYRKLRKLEHEQVLANERERIMRDMHDGVGGHLVSALAMAENNDVPPERFRELLGNALQDLRLVIDSMDQTDGDLASVLGMLRARLQGSLEQSGIRVRWKVGDLPLIPELGPDRVLQIMRILQEAITNVLKHARARTLTVRSGADEHSVFIEIADDGKGLPDKEQRHGHGLGNMFHRARRAGLTLEIGDASPGTCLRLTVPLNPQ